MHVVIASGIEVLSGCSSVGRAQPCQGWGHEFESRYPLQAFSKLVIQNLYHGAVAEWRCSGLQIRTIPVRIRSAPPLLSA